MKKLITSVLVIVLLLGCCVGVLAACVDTTDYDTTIIFYSQQNDNLQKITASAIASFEAKYPGWHVEHRVQSGGYDGIRDKIVSELGGKKQPDLAYCYPDHVALYMQTRKVIDASIWVNSEEKIDTVINGQTEQLQIGYTADEKATFISTFWNECMATNFTDYDKYGYAETSMLTLPFVKSTELMFYNKDALKLAGDKFWDSTNNCPTAKTWDDIWAQAPELAELYPLATIVGYDSEANWFITESERQGWGYTSTNPEQHYLFDNEDAAAWLDKLGAMADPSKAYITTQQVYGSYTSNLFKLGVGTEKDKNGNLAMGEPAGGVIYCIGSSGGATNQEADLFDWGVTYVPASVKADGTTSDLAISQGPSLVMLQCDRAQDKDLKAKMTFLFAKELLSEKIQASVSKEQGYMPCRNNVAEKISTYADFLDDDEDIKAIAVKLSQQLALDGKCFTSPAFVGSSTARNQVGTALQLVIEGKGSVLGADVLADAYKYSGGK